MDPKHLHIEVVTQSVSFLLLNMGPSSPAHPLTFLTEEQTTLFGPQKQQQVKCPLDMSLLSLHFCLSLSLPLFFFFFNRERAYKTQPLSAKRAQALRRVMQSKHLGLCCSTGHSKAPSELGNVSLIFSRPPKKEDMNVSVNLLHSRLFKGNKHVTNAHLRL